MSRAVDWDKGPIVMGSRGNCGREIGDREYRQKGSLSFTCTPDLHVEQDEWLVHRNRRKGLVQGPDAAGGQCSGWNSHKPLQMTAVFPVK